MSELADVNMRLDRLERANQRWKGVALAALLTAVFAVLQATVQTGTGQQVEIIQPGRTPDIRVPKPIAETVAARTIVLCDHLDKPRLVLTAEGMVVLDTRTKPRLVLTEKGLALQDDERVLRAALTPEKLAIFHNGGAEFTRVDADGFILTDGKGQVRACLKADNRGSYLDLGDKQNRIIFGSDAVLAALRAANIRISSVESDLFFISTKLR